LFRSVASLLFGLEVSEMVEPAWERRYMYRYRLSLSPVATKSGKA
jgi:hypothetical protein